MNDATMDLSPLDSAQWRDRCAVRITELDDQIGIDEARDIAEHACAFERTRAMAPGAAADFIAAEMGRPGRRLERRSPSRRAAAAAVQPI